MAPANPILAYHSVAPWERMTPAEFDAHLALLARSGLPSLGSAELGTGAVGYLLTFDDGFADAWTHVLPLLEARGGRAVVFAIPSRAGDGPVRPQGTRAFGGTAADAHAQAAQAPGPHPGFLRWSELAALEASGRVTVQSHSWSHRQGWVGDEILGFHRVGRPRWFVPEITGDDRAGLPVYRRGSALAHRRYADDPDLREALVGWLERRGGAAYVAGRGARAVTRELQAVAAAHRRAHPWDGWEGEEERRARTRSEIAEARRALASRLGGDRDELCLPWGQYDAVTLELAREAGVRRVYTLDRTPNPIGGAGLRVGRFEPRAGRRRALGLALWLYRSTLRAGAYACLTGRR